MEHLHEPIVGLAAIFILGSAAQWLGWRMKLPSILLLLGFGFVAGPATGLVEPDEMLGELLFPIVSLSVSLILFEGALSLRLRELREIGGVLVALLTVGVVITWLLTTLFAWLILRFDIIDALLLGAILVVTGPTVVGPMLRHIRPEGPVGPIARWEGIVIDPIGAVLAVLVFEVRHVLRDAELEQATMTAMLTLGETLLYGTLLGGGVALLLAWLLRRHRIPDHLQNSVTLMFVVAVFTVSDVLKHESGLVAVTIMGIVLTNSPRVSIKHILEFKENLSVLLISSLFILLTARLEIAGFEKLGWNGLYFLLAMLLIVRPVAVIVSSVNSQLAWREIAFLSWLAPRGIVAAAVSSVFALKMGGESSGLVPATFLVIIGTVVVYGLTAYPLARWLKLASESPQGVLFLGASRLPQAIAEALHQAGLTVLMVDLNRENIQQARLAGIPTKVGNVLSERVQEELHLGGIGRFFAMTPNDEANSLAAQEFYELFGRPEVYRLAPAERVERHENAAHEVPGRDLFGEEMTYDRLDERLANGAVVKATKLTEEFDLDSFRELYGESLITLFVLTADGELDVHTDEVPLEPIAGDTVIALVDDVG